jgi:hypothetical protein
MGARTRNWYQRSKHWLAMGAGALAAGWVALSPDCWYWG